MSDSTKSLMERATELTERYHAEIGQPGEIDWGKHADFASAAIDNLGDLIAASVADSAEKSPAPEGGEAGGAGVLREHRAPAPSSVGGLIQFSNVAASAMAKDAERYRWWRNWVFRARSEGLPTWSPPTSTQLSTLLSRHPQRREIRHEREDIEVDPQKRTPMLLIRRCRDGQASYPIPCGIPGPHGRTGESRKNARGAGARV